MGAVVETDRGSLPFALVHGEPLVACAVWALGEAGVFVVDLGTSWAAVTDADVPFVLHDPLCPLTPPQFIAECVAHAAERAAVTVGIRPVTDTVKELHDDRRRRDPRPRRAAPGRLPGGAPARRGRRARRPTDHRLRGAGRRAGRAVPGRDRSRRRPQARRVADEDDLRVLEALTAPRGQG